MGLPAQRRLAGTLIAGALCTLSSCSLELPGTGVSADGGAAIPEGSPDSNTPGDAGFGGLQGGGLEAGSVTEGDASVFAPNTLPMGCQLTGRYASLVTFDVTWVGTQFANIVPVISEGQGKLSFVVIGDFSPSGPGAATTTAVFRTCQARVPEFISTLPQERYQARFADAVWDSPRMPTFKGELTTCAKPPCALGSTVIHAFVGSALSSPDAPWPTSGADGIWPDHDGDGRPGISTNMLGPSDDARYAHPPVDLFAFRRVQRLDLGLRVILRLDGQRDSCDTMSGDARDGRVDTRALDCTVFSRSSSCSAEEIRFLDDNLPAWTVGQGTFRAVRLQEAGAGCEQARQMFGFTDGGSP